MFSAIRSSNAGHALPRTPVAIFVGGTSGIGRSMAEAFARYTKGNAHIVLIGRNQAAAESILVTLPKSNVNPSIPFIHAYPGSVRTPISSKADSAFLLITLKAALFLFCLITVSSEECAEYMWYGSLNSTENSAGVRGARRIGSNGENLALNVTLATTANGRSFGSIHGNLFLSTEPSLDGDNGEGGIP
ncbi:hypothetical protein AX14_008971 [Amanita brunnescens Koide BX004]|nr:hypothetical protein AX14_008971 [Amanita brunnescens Koide BX004]